MHSVGDNEVDKHLGQPVPVMDDNVTVDSIINEELCEEESVLHLPPIDEKLSELLTHWLGKKLKNCSSSACCLVM